jgi:ABC-type multidrug transport system fused ATPase/permease subunit
VTRAASTTPDPAVIDAGEHLIERAPWEVGQSRAEPMRKPIDWVVCKRLLGYMWRYPWRQLGIAAHGVGIAAIHTVQPFIVAETIRWTIEHPQRWRDLTGTEPVVGVMFGAGLVALTAILFYVTMGSRIRLVSRTTNRVVFDLRHDVVSHILRQDMRFFDRNKSGRLLARATSDVDAVRVAVADIFPRTLIHGLMMISMSAVMLFYDWPLAIAIFALTPVGWVFLVSFRGRMGEAYRLVQESFSRLTATIAESVAGIRVTKSFAREPVNQELFRRQCLAHRGHNMRAAHVHGLYLPMFQLGGDLIAALIIVFGGYRVVQGHTEVSDLIGFLLCAGGFFVSIIVLAELYNTTLRAMAGGERIFEILDTPPTIVDAVGAEPMPRLEGGMRVELDHVSFAYDEGDPVLEDVSLTVEPGRALALVGHTGSGKTTIVRLIDRLYERTAGAIRLDDRPIEAYTLASIHRQIALVLQDNYLFSGSVADNIRFARPDASIDEVRDTCDRLACLDLLERLPRGLDTEVGERGESLSLGQRQLVCFARAMIADPRLLMLDEATSAVDTFTEHRLQIALERLMEGRTSIVVAHRLSTVRRADEIVVIDGGRIVERGDHDGLLGAGGRYAGLYHEFVRMSRG